MRMVGCVHVSGLFVRLFPPGPDEVRRSNPNHLCALVVRLVPLGLFDPRSDRFVISSQHPRMATLDNYSVIENLMIRLFGPDNSPCEQATPTQCARSCWPMRTRHQQPSDITVTLLADAHLERLRYLCY